MEGPATPPGLEPVRQPTQPDETSIAVSKPAERDEAPERDIDDDPESDLPDLGEAMSTADAVVEPALKRYRCNVNYLGLGAGTWIEIDPEDPGWWEPIEQRWLVSEADWEGPENG